MAHSIKLPFDEYLPDPNYILVGEGNAALTNAKQSNFCAFLCIFEQLPGKKEQKAYDSEKTYKEAKKIFDQEYNKYHQHPLFHEHPWLVAFAIAARMTTLEITDDRMFYTTRFSCNKCVEISEKEILWCNKNGLKTTKQKDGEVLVQQELYYLNNCGYRQSAVVPALLEMVNFEGDKKTRAESVIAQSLFIISKNSWLALQGLSPEPEPTALMGRDSLAFDGAHAEIGYTPNVTRPNALLATAIYKRASCSV